MSPFSLVSNSHGFLAAVPDTQGQGGVSCGCDAGTISSHPLKRVVFSRWASLLRRWQYLKSSAVRAVLTLGASGPAPFC